MVSISKKLNEQEIAELENPYFDVHAEIGITKHVGGRCGHVVPQKANHQRVMDFHST